MDIIDLPRQVQDLKVQYESEDYLVVSKGYDLHINTNDPNVKITLQSQLEDHYPELVNDALGHKFHFCHRLDYATSGLLCIAKNKKAAAVISKALQKRRVTKIYVALLRNTVAEEILDIKQAIGEPPDPLLAKLRVCVDCGEKQRPAHTRLLLLQTGTYNGAPASKVLLLAVTGRRHQLRAHAASLGHTIVGDYTYSDRLDNDPPRMMLHAYHFSLPLNASETRNHQQEHHGWPRLAEKLQLSLDSDAESTYLPSGATMSVTSEDPFIEEANCSLWHPQDTVNPFNEATMNKLIKGR